MISTKISNPDLLWLIEVVVFHDPTKDYQLQDKDNLRHKVPQYKSLFNALPFCGLPIGNLTSQFFANVYLNALDQFVKHQLKCRFYLRYVDDFVLLHTDAAKLTEWKQSISDFLQQTLHLTLNERATRLAPVSGGIDFAGFIIRADYRLVRRRVIGNLKEKLRNARKRLVITRPECVTFYFHQETLKQTLATVNSYLGHLRHGNSRNCIRNIFKEFSFLTFFYRVSFRKIVRFDRPLRKKYTLRKQIHWCSFRFSRYLCLFEVGCYFEAFDTDARILAEITGYGMKKNWRCKRYACGFPRSLLNSVLNELKRFGIPVAVFRQTGKELLKTMERLPYLILDYPERDLVQ
jgi:hypothetical protein